MLKKQRNPWGNQWVRQTVSWLLALVIAVTGIIVDAPGLASWAAVNDGGFALELAWIEENEKKTEYTWISTSDEVRYVRLRVNYSNREAVKEGTAPSYDAGSLVITVPGIGDANRLEVMKAYDVAADLAGSDAGNKRWSYTYNSIKDVYTFTNKEAILANSSFEGYFELVWRFRSRDCVGEEDGKPFTRRVSATMRAPGNVKLTTDEVAYTYEGKKDEYSLKEITPAEVYGSGGMTIPEGETAESYIWRGQTIDGSYQMRGRGIDIREKNTEYYIVELPEGAVVGRAEDAYESLLAVSRYENGSGKNLWKIAQRIGAEYEGYLPARSPWMTLYTGYPKDTYTNREVSLHVGLWGRFYDTGSEAELLDEKEYVFNVGEYGYGYPPGNIYDFHKCIKGNFVHWEDSQPQYRVFTDEKRLFGRELTKTYYLNGLVRYPQLNPGKDETMAYDLELVDDFIDVTKLDGGFKQLGPEDYEFTSVTIPSTKNLGYGHDIIMTPDRYAVSVFAMYDTDWELIEVPGLKIPMRIASSPNAEKEPDIASTPDASKQSDNTMKVPGENRSNKVIWALTALDTLPLELMTEEMQDELDRWETASPSDASPSGASPSNADKEDGLTGTQRELLNLLAAQAVSSYTCLLREKEQTVDIPAKADGSTAHRVKIVIHNLQESIYFTDGFRCNVKFHVQEDPEVDDNAGSRVMNNSYIRILTGAAGTEKSWFNAEGIHSSEWTKDRDLTEYGDEYELGDGKALHRDVSTLWLKEHRCEFWTGVSAGTPAAHEIYEGSRIPLELNSHFRYTEPDTLQNFTLSTILPEGLVVDPSIQTGIDLWDAAEITGIDDMSGKQLRQFCTVEMIEDYKGSGRVYISFNFELPKPVESPDGTVEVKMDGFVSKEDVVLHPTGTFTGVTTVNDGVCPNLIAIYGNGVDNGSYVSGEEEIWTDVDRDGDEGEVISYSNRIVDYGAVAEEGQTVTAEYLRTTDTDRQFIQWNEGDEAAYQTFGELYTYRLTVQTAGNPGQNVVFYDMLETGDQKEETSDKTEWKGRFRSVDTSYMEEVFGLIPTVYYTVKESPSDDLLSGDWLSEEPADRGSIRGIAVDFGDAQLEKGVRWIVDVQMEAPEPQAGLKGKITENSYKVVYRPIAGTVVGDQESLPSNKVQVQLTDPLGSLKLKKIDKEDKSDLSGAVFSLYKQGTVAPVRTGITTGVDGIAEIPRLEYGTYYLEETEAPQGYQPKTGRFPEEGIVIGGSTPRVRLELPNDRKPGSAVLTKRSDIDPLMTLSGAVFDLYRGEELYRKDLMTGVDGTLLAENLPWGNYQFRETKAPKGHEVNTAPVPFTIDTAHVDQEIKVEVKDKSLPVTIRLVKTELLEDGMTPGTGADGQKVVLEGGTYQLYRKERNEDGGDYARNLGTYVTDELGEIYVEELKAGSYYFRETIPPTGYLAEAEDIAFEITIDDVVNFAENPEMMKTVGTTDTRKAGSLILSKTNETGAAIEGVEFTLYRQKEAEGEAAEWEEVERYTTNAEGIIEINGDGDKTLTWGIYKMVETAVPKGYELDPDNPLSEEFMLDAQTVEKQVQIKFENIRAKGRVKLVKENEMTPAERLNGAVYTLYDQEGNIIKDDLTTGELLTDPETGENLAEPEQGAVLVEGLDWGSYYFKEKKAPKGYSVSDELIRFSVNYLTAGAENLQTLTAVDKVDQREITVTKRILAEDIVYEHGTPTFTFRLAGGTPEVSYYKSVAFTREYVEANTMADGYVEQSVIFAGLDNFQTYTATELGTVRYRLDEVTIPDQNVLGITVDGESAHFELDADNKDMDVRAVFTNVKVTDAGGSHTSQSVNIVKAGKKITGLAADYKGGILTSAQIPGGDLDVYVIYDDGNQELLPRNGYEILGLENLADNTALTLKASYRDDTGKVWTAAFAVRTGSIQYFTWIVLDDGTAQITGYLGTAKTVIFPEKVTGDDGVTRVVTKVGGISYGNPAAVSGLWGKAVGVVLPDTLKEIQDRAFYGIESLTEELKIPTGVISIGKEAFEGCRGLTGSLIIPDTVTSIGDGAFRYCNSLAGELKLSNKVSKIGEAAFYNCGGLTGSLKIPDSVTIIERNVFQGCSGLTGELVIPDSVASIGMYAFNGCSALTGSLKIPDSVTSIGTGAFSACRGFTGDLTIPANMTSVEGHVFSGCTGFTGELKIPEGVTTIGASAFEGCTGFTGELKIPEGMTTIGASAFSRCTGFTGELKIPEGVTTIGAGAFRSCTGFTGELKIPNKVTAIESGSFNGCSGFTGELKIPNGVTSIGEYAFDGCSGLTGSLNIPDGVASIGNFAFHSCGFTEEVIIPVSVTNIGQYTFNNCKGLQSISVKNKNCTIYDAETTFPKQAILKGYDPSTLKDYADKYTRTFEKLTN